MNTTPEDWKLAHVLYTVLNKEIRRSLTLQPKFDISSQQDPEKLDKLQLDNMIPDTQDGFRSTCTF